MDYLRQDVKVFYKQDTLLIDNGNKVYKVLSCLDLKWLIDGKGYYLTAKYMYTKEQEKCK